jgi:hypothetical protein
MSNYNYEDFFLNINDVVELFRQASFEKKPLSLARFGHAEMSVAFYPYPDWIKKWKFKDYVGATGSPKQIQEDLWEAIKTTDIVGFHTSKAREEADRITAEETKKLLSRLNIQPRKICDAWITHAFLDNPSFWELLRHLKVVLIGRRSKEAEPYFQKRGISVVGTYSLEGYTEINSVFSQLCQNHDWDLALISAGIPASILAPKLAHACGKLTIDFGHALDKIIEGDSFNHNKIAKKFSQSKEGLVHFDGNKKLDHNQLYWNIKNDFTYEFWVKPEQELPLINQSTKGTEGVTGQRFVIFPGHTEDYLQAGAGVSVGTNGVTVLEHTHSHLPATLVYNTQIVDWTHIAVVFKCKTPSLFINGEFVKDGHHSTMENVFASGIIGGLSPYGHFVGYIKNLRIWDHAREPEMIKNNMNKDFPLNEDGLFFQWRGFRNNDIQFQEPINTPKIWNNSMENKKVKLIAFYLPQFHEIPENNQWWGKGFTEWANTKKAQPLFSGHYQPKEPFQNYYYDLTDSSVRNWQADLAKDYGIYGFCYYHYWFNGKMLLEKPLNEVLRTGEPDFPFCLSWANEPWTRKWDGRNDLILMPQEYGDEKDWKEHFDYLLKVFQDKRYIRIEDKPLFLIYRPEIIPDCPRMLLYWDELAKQNGLNGIYFINTLNGHYPFCEIQRFDASVQFEPHYTLALESKTNLWHTVRGDSKKLALDYDKIWSIILNRQANHQDKKMIPGAFVDWDNTARRGKDASLCVGASPKKFEKYLSQQIIRAKTLYQSEFLFINAWNEWAEGAYLEPDNKYQFQYLQAVENALKNQ